MFNGLKLVYVGDGRNNMANSLMIGSTKLGIHFTILAPKELWPEQSLIQQCEEYAKNSGSKIEISDNLMLLMKRMQYIRMSGVPWVRKTWQRNV